MENPFGRGGAATAFLPPTHLHKRSGRTWTHTLLSLILGFSALIGIWFLGVRPSLHHQAVVQLDTAWSGAETWASSYLSNLHDKRKTLFLSEKGLSNALNTYDAHAVQNWQVTVTPANIRLSFNTCGQMCSVTAILSVSSTNEIQVTHVQAQGMFAFIM